MIWKPYHHWCRNFITLSRANRVKGRNFEQQGPQKEFLYSRVSPNLDKLVITRYESQSGLDLTAVMDSGIARKL